MDPPGVASRALAGCVNTCLLVLSIGLFWAGTGDWVASCDTSTCIGTTSDVIHTMVHDAIVYEFESHFEASLLMMFMIVAIVLCCVSNALSAAFNVGSYTVLKTCRVGRLFLSNPFPVGAATFALVVIVQWVFLANRSDSFTSVHLNCTVECTSRYGASETDGNRFIIAALVLATVALLANMLGLWFCAPSPDLY